MAAEPKQNILYVLELLNLPTPPPQENDNETLMASFEALDKHIGSISGQAAEQAIFLLVSAHPWTNITHSVHHFTVGSSKWVVYGCHAKVIPTRMKQYIKGECGTKSIPKEYQFCNDDQTYACSFDKFASQMSYLLRRYLPRGFTYFEVFTTHIGTKEVENNDVSMFSLHRKILPDFSISLPFVYSCIVRGLNKFTGLTDEDEDEKSVASDSKRLFFVDGVSYTDADYLGVSVKSNGANGKGCLRRIAGVDWVFAGSKNTCLACPLSCDPEQHYPYTNPEIIGPPILHLFHKLCVKILDSNMHDMFIDMMIQQQLVILFEYNSESNEHLFPIHGSYLEAFALRRSCFIDFAVHPMQSFDFFSKCQIPCVDFELRPNLPQEIPALVQSVRDRRDIEGVVIYFICRKKVTGALKVKSDYYVIGRAIRQKLWGMIRYIKKALQEEDETQKFDIGEKIRNTKRMIGKRMRDMKQLSDYAQKAPIWAECGIKFVEWWVYQLNECKSDRDKLRFIAKSESKFGSLYHEYYYNIYSSSTTCSTSDEKSTTSDEKSTTSDEKNRI